MQSNLRRSSPQIGGTWAKSSPDIQLGYLFLDVVPASVNQTAAWVKASGMGYVMINSAWYITSGHYNVSIGVPGYWGGLAGLAAVCRGTRPLLYRDTVQRWI